MEAVELRGKLHKYIDQADDRLLRVLHAVFESYTNEEEVVAHTISGQPLTKSEYVQRVKDADAAIERGEFTTVEDLEDEMQKW